MINPNLNKDKNSLNPGWQGFWKHYPTFLHKGISGGSRSWLKNLQIFIKAAKIRGEALIIFFHGPPGLGKTTLSRIVANELEVKHQRNQRAVIEKPGDLAGLFTSLEPRDVLFIDEIHRLSNVVEEYLYAAMEDYRFW